MPPNAGTSIAIWANRSSNVPVERGTTGTPIEDAWTAGNVPITTRDTTATARTILATRRRETMAIPGPQERFGYMTVTFRAACSRDSWPERTRLTLAGGSFCPNRGFELKQRDRHRRPMP